MKEANVGTLADSFSSVVRILVRVKEANVGTLADSFSSVVRILEGDLGQVASCLTPGTMRRPILSKIGSF